MSLDEATKNTSNLLKISTEQVRTYFYDQLHKTGLRQITIEMKVITIWLN